MDLWTAFVLGLVGSLHCAGMCGPLALALPVTGRTIASHLLGRLAYNLGRMATYGLLGVVFGLIGQTFALAGLQRWVSLIAGATILLGLVASSRHAVGTPAVKAVVWLKSGLGKLLQRRTLASLYSLGALNGLLPCGLVYAACAGAVARDGVLSGLEYMLAFGLGTLPMMLGIGFAGSKLRVISRWKLQRVVPVCLVALGVLLIVRGMALGIPYLSPDLGAPRGHGATCH
jgi:sulfite exporter TauE/SafE